ncbi:Phage-associated protein, partial [human gut metagenome]
VAGRGRRVFTDAEAAADAAEKAGYVSRETRPLPLSAIEKAMGRKRFAEVLGDLVTKTEGVPLLVAASDPRPAWEPVTPQSELHEGEIGRAS